MQFTLFYLDFKEDPFSENCVETNWTKKPTSRDHCDQGQCETSHAKKVTVFLAGHESTK